MKSEVAGEDHRAVGFRVSDVRARAQRHRAADRQEFVEDRLLPARLSAVRNPRVGISRCPRQPGNRESGAGKILGLREFSLRKPGSDREEWLVLQKAPAI